MDDNELENRRLELFSDNIKPRPTNEIIQLSWNGALIFVFIIVTFLGVDEFTTGDKSIGLAILINLFSIVISFLAGRSFAK